MPTEQVPDQQQREAASFYIPFPCPLCARVRVLVRPVPFRIWCEKCDIEGDTLREAIEEKEDALDQERDKLQELREGIDRQIEAFVMAGRAWRTDSTAADIGEVERAGCIAWSAAMELSATRLRALLHPESNEQGGGE